ncbi:Demethylsterigmatocystin 6-O-methyltransferase 8 [Paraphaeosphaeria minitans]|uniref:Demethylsterigmatocystin 6-O-methyltransferase 8 n=1 Tax=Paraphaeosphaeria minitans TaxID=565426 RepID=A0A9P6G7Y8_9PLEO|nr:Demethylsterigmatocystin 6-O-methyltransferase 8 [Paraphaeosphaeria minitans]
MRLALLAKARDLVRALESPRETMAKHLWAQPLRVTDIASKVGTNVPMLGRLLNHIGAMGYIKETDADTYAPTSFSNALTIPAIGDSYPFFVKGLLPATLHFPAHLAQTNYATPADVRSGAFQSALKTEKNMFEYLTTHPPLGQRFNSHMGGYRLGRSSWMHPGSYPVKERLIKGMLETNTTLLVDIGGSLGHDLQEFATRYPNEPGRLILQDLPAVMDAIQSLHPNIERTKHDFFTEQPVKAARAYYLHSILHDWPDQVCKVILKQVADAMEPGYSKLLIHENIIPGKSADSEVTAMDMMMAILLSSKERTEEEWYALLEVPELGLKISGIWQVSGAESLIECTRVGDGMA